MALTEEQRAKRREKRKLNRAKARIQVLDRQVSGTPVGDFKLQQKKLKRERTSLLADAASEKIATHMAGLRANYSVRVIQAAAMIALPMERPALRIASRCLPTALASPYNFTSETIADPDISDVGRKEYEEGYTLHACTRSPLMGSIKWCGAAGVQEYHLEFLPPGPTPSVTQQTVYMNKDEVLRINPLYLSDQSLTGDGMHGPTLYPVNVGTSYYFWVNEGEISLLFVAGKVPTALGQMKLRIYNLSGLEENLLVDTDVYDVSLPTVRYALPYSTIGYGMYVRIELQTTSTCPEPIEIEEIAWSTVAGNSAGWCFSPIRGFDTKINDVGELATVGVAMHLANTAEALKKNGSIVLAQVPASNPFWTQFREGPHDAYRNLASDNIANHMNLGFETGGYAYMKPDDIDSLHFQTYGSSIVNSNLPFSISTDLQKLGGWLAAGISLQLQGVSVIGNHYTVTTGFAVNFVTQDP